MQEKLKLIQKLSKSIARHALEIENTIDYQVENGQWNSWDERSVERNADVLEDYVGNIKILLNALKSIED